jgi:hypothetical protein
MSDVNYTGQNVPVVSFFSELELSEQEYIELYRNDKIFRDLINRFVELTKKINEFSNDGVAL